MTNDELHALADALEPMAKAPRFEDFDVPAFCAWVRACADAQPVAWQFKIRVWIGGDLFEERDHVSREWREGAVPLYLHPAPAAPQAEPQNIRERWNIERQSDGSLLVCFNLHEKGEKCEYEHFVPARQAEPKREPLSEATALIEWPESAKWKNRAALEGIERSCMGEPKREPSCLWSRADDDTDVWETKCGHAFTIIDGTPGDNHMEFCCYCGRPLEQEIGGSDAGAD